MEQPFYFIRTDENCLVTLISRRLFGESTRLKNTYLKAYNTINPVNVLEIKNLISVRDITYIHEGEKILSFYNLSLLSK